MDPDAALELARAALEGCCENFSPLVGQELPVSKVERVEAGDCPDGKFAVQPLCTTSADGDEPGTAELAVGLKGAKALGYLLLGQEAAEGTEDEAEREATEEEFEVRSDREGNVSPADFIPMKKR